ncbi:MAG: PD40 domain-containing protein [Bacteriovoracaceae bacterium]|nr:PD40 domain-containing protein [Bacteriovoracaceae bacterium]
MKKFVGLYLFLLFSGNLAAAIDGLTVIPVGEATLVKDQMYFEAPYFREADISTKYQKVAMQLVQLLKDDFSFYKRIFGIKSFKSLRKDADLAPVYEYWSARGVNYLCRSTFFIQDGKLRFKITVFNITNKTPLLQLQGGPLRVNDRAIGHKIAQAIYKKIVKKDSIFNSKISFVSDVLSKKGKMIKELYIMDFDGHNIRRITNYKATVISPAISPDGTKILYSLIKERTGRRRRNINLRVYDLKEKDDYLISSRRGINSGAIFLPGGDKIALTLSHVGNAEIYIMDLKTKKIKRVTKHFAIDVDPSFTAVGNKMAFLSGRSGAAMVYTLNPAGIEKEIRRISYVGKYNATPRFSPDGKTIVFSSWLDQRFDIFRINTDGTGLSRLTKQFGSNEDPSFSKDGEFIIFSSQRVLSRTKAIQNIYIMGKDGEIIKAITKNFGNCITPRWSN